MVTAPSQPLPRLRVVTREIDAVEDVLEYASAADPLVWARRSDILVGVGAAVRFAGDGTADSGALSRWWNDVVAAADVDDAVRSAGTGLVALGAFPFDAHSSAAPILTVPSVIVGRRGGRSWVTTVSGASPAPIPTPVTYGPHWSATLGPGLLPPEAYQAAVSAALGAITHGDLHKVVLARDLVGSVPSGADLRRLVRALASAYPDTWVFAVDGLIGASPETLVTLAGGTITARVLAGTSARGADADSDLAASLDLATSAKDLDEHRFAVQSVLSALTPHTSALAAAEAPFTLKLPNVWHLATDVEGTVRPGASALDLVWALHPTAAVAGTPTTTAQALIRTLEPFDRGRYSGPVGWIDADGNGEWAIALRCAQFDVHRHERQDGPIAVTAHAGAGIVAGSNPEAEMLETRVKFRPIVDALA